MEKWNFLSVYHCKTDVYLIFYSDTEKVSIHSFVGLATVMDLERIVINILRKYKSPQYFEM